MPCSRRVLCFTAGCGTGVPSDTNSTSVGAVRASRGQDVAGGVDVPVVDGRRTGRPTPGRAAPWPRRWPRTPSTPGSTGTTGRPGRTCARAGAPCRRACRRTSTSPHRAPTLARRVRARPDTARSSTYDRLGSRGRSWWTACGASPGGCPRPGRGLRDLAARALPVTPSRAGAGRVPLRAPAASRRPCARSAGRRPSSRPTAPRSGSAPGRSPPRLHEAEEAGRELPRRTSSATALLHPRSPSPTTGRWAAPRPAHRHVPDPRESQRDRRGSTGTGRPG